MEGCSLEFLIQKRAWPVNSRFYLTLEISQSCGRLFGPSAGEFLLTLSPTVLATDSAGLKKMKRLRDDVMSNSQIKRPSSASASASASASSSRAESYVPGGGGGEASGGVGGGPQKLSINDAITYMKQLKDAFQDRREKVETFGDVIQDFRAGRIDIPGVIARVKELFKGYNNLIFGFSTFLPKGYKITVIDGEPPQKEVEAAISYVNKIKQRFPNDDHVYKSFLDILVMYKNENKGINDVYEEVATLFDEHPDLVDGFSRFLPAAFAAELALA